MHGTVRSSPTVGYVGTTQKRNVLAQVRLNELERLTARQGREALGAPALARQDSVRGSTVGPSSVSLRNDLDSANRRYGGV